MLPRSGIDGSAADPPLPRHGQGGDRQRAPPRRSRPASTTWPGGPEGIASPTIAAATRPATPPTPSDGSRSGTGAGGEPDDALLAYPFAAMGRAGLDRLHRLPRRRGSGEATWSMSPPGGGRAARSFPGGDAHERTDQVWVADRPPAPAVGRSIGSGGPPAAGRRPQPGARRVRALRPARRPRAPPAGRPGRHGGARPGHRWPSSIWARASAPCADGARAAVPAAVRRGFVVVDEPIDEAVRPRRSRRTAAATA